MQSRRWPQNNFTEKISSTLMALQHYPRGDRDCGGERRLPIHDRQVYHPRVAAGRQSRAQLGEPFQNEWLNFTLGYHSSPIATQGVIEGSLPAMVGAQLRFTLTQGVLDLYVSPIAALTQSIHWLSENNLMYVIDSLSENVIEYKGLNPYVDRPSATLRY